jgi:hypothetical protein
MKQTEVQGRVLTVWGLNFVCLILYLIFNKYTAIRNFQTLKYVASIDLLYQCLLGGWGKVLKPLKILFKIGSQKVVIWTTVSPIHIWNTTHLAASISKLCVLLCERYKQWNWKLNIHSLNFKCVKIGTGSGHLWMRYELSGSIKCGEFLDWLQKS